MYLSIQDVKDTDSPLNSNIACIRTSKSIHANFIVPIFQNNTMSTFIRPKYIIHVVWRTQMDSREQWDVFENGTILSMFLDFQIHSVH